jgi:hypothetical protein
MDVKEIECDGLEWIHFLVQNRYHWQVIVNMVMNLQVHKMQGIS